MNRSQLEQQTLQLIISLTAILAVGAIVSVANEIFRWDLFPPFISTLLYFSGFAIAVVIVASLFINVVLNISRVVYYIQKITEKYLSE